MKHVIVEISTDAKWSRELGDQINKLSQKKTEMEKKKKKRKRKQKVKTRWIIVLSVECSSRPHLFPLEVSFLQYHDKSNFLRLAWPNEWYLFVWK